MPALSPFRKAMSNPSTNRSGSSSFRSEARRRTFSASPSRPSAILLRARVLYAMAKSGSIRSESINQQVGEFQFSLGGPPKNVLGFPQPAQCHIVEGQGVIRDGKIRIDLDRFPAFFRRLFELAEDRINRTPQQSVGIPLARISLPPQLAGL